MQRHLLIPISCLVLSIGCQENSEVSENSPRPERRTSHSTLEKSFYLKHDFGVHDQGKEVSASVELQNDTDKPVRFGFSKASCGCVTIKAIPKEIAPGESGTFEFSVNTNGLSGRRVYSVVAWDAEPKTILSKIEAAIIVRSVEPRPRSISLGDLSLNADFEKDLFVTVAGYPDAKIVSAESNASWLSTELQDASTGDNLKEQGVRAIGCCKVKWTGEGAIPGPVSAVITVKVKVDEEREETLTIPVSGYVTGSLECLPSRVVFTQLKKNDAVERTCLLTFNESVPDINGVTCVTTHDFVTAEVKKKSSSANQWELTTTAKLPDAPAAGLSQGEIVGKDINGKVIFSIPYTALTLVSRKEE